MEFKRLSDVEVVAEPTESANVLIEENGVIKKAPKTAVGGAGGEADLVIRIDAHIEDATINSISIVSGSVEAVYDTFESGEFPIVEVEVVVTSNMDSWVRTARKIPTQIIFYGDYLHVLFLSPSLYGNQCYSCRIVYNSANAYSLSGFNKHRITTTV